MYTKIDDKTKAAIYAAQAKAIQRLIANYTNITVAAVEVGVSESTLRNWSRNDKRSRVMSPQAAVRIEAITAGRGRGKAFKKGDFRPDLFIKGWTA